MSQTKCHIPSDTKFQEPVDLKASLHNFRVYVNDTEYFMSNLPHVFASGVMVKHLMKMELKTLEKLTLTIKLNHTMQCYVERT